MAAAAPRFSAETLRFLRALKRNNQRDWFKARKDRYETLLRAPLTEIIERLALDFRARASARADEIDTELDKAEANIADRRHELAATYRSHAETASLNFDFATAAARYGDAYEQVAKLDVPLAYRLKVLQGEALNDHGVYQNDNQALLDSVVAYEQALEIGIGGLQSGQ